MEMRTKSLYRKCLQEPVDNPCDLGEFYQRTGVAIALDESVDEGLVGRRQTDLPLGTAQGIVALVSA
jgi:O-succinylbenzoate synthase